MKKENLETLLNKMCSTGADFAEVYIENTTELMPDDLICLSRYTIDIQAIHLPSI